MITLAIVDDHRLVATGVQRLLEDEGGFRVVGLAATIREGLDLVERERPDMTLLDVRVPGGRGLAEIGSFRACHPGGRVVVLTGFGDELRESALGHGADAFLTKEQASSTLASTLRRLAGIVATPVDLLTRRELQIAEAVSGGLSNPEAAEALMVSVNTIKTHLASAMRKLGVHDRVELSLKWRTTLAQAVAARREP